MPNVGRKAEKNHTQSVVFEKKADWTEASSRKWMEEHDYFTDGLDETESSFRWRQYDPDDGKFDYRTKVIEKDSIYLILGILKKKGADAFMKKIEERAFPFELRQAEDGKKIVGHAAVFNQWSEDMGGFREMIRPGAFSKTLKEADVRALFNHDVNYVLGRNKAGTLQLEEDKTGLGVIIEPPDTTWASDLQVSMKRGDVNQMSFMFETMRDEWDKADPKDLKRELIEVKLYDVSVVTFPAYPQTLAHVRLMEAISRSRTEEIDEQDRELILSMAEKLGARRAPQLESAPGQGPHPDEEGLAKLTILKKRLELAEKI